MLSDQPPHLSKDSEIRAIHVARNLEFRDLQQQASRSRSQHPCEASLRFRGASAGFSCGTDRRSALAHQGPTGGPSLWDPSPPALLIGLFRPRRAGRNFESRKANLLAEIT